MTTIISFVNQKGGVGKTTSVINVSAVLAQMKSGPKENKVLVIDMDPQANTSQIFTSITDTDLSIYNLLIQQNQNNQVPEDISIKNLIQPTYIKNLNIIPSNVLLSSAEIELVNIHGRETILKRILKENKNVLDAYDYIIIDCQPSLGLLTINSIIASDYLMVPLQADVFSLTGVDLLTDTISKLQNIFEIDCTILGLFFTQVQKNASLFKEAYELCQENYGKLVFNSYIRNNISIDHANAMDQSIVDFDPNSNSAQDYISITKELVKKLK